MTFVYAQLCLHLDFLAFRALILITFFGGFLISCGENQETRHCEKKLRMKATSCLDIKTYKPNDMTSSSAFAYLKGNIIRHTIYVVTFFHKIA